MYTALSQRFWGWLLSFQIVGQTSDPETVTTAEHQTNLGSDCACRILISSVILSEHAQFFVSLRVSELGSQWVLHAAFEAFSDMLVVLSTVSAQSKRSTKACGVLNPAADKTTDVCTLNPELSPVSSVCTMHMELAGVDHGPQASDPRSLWRGHWDSFSDVHDFLTAILRKLQEQYEPSTRQLRRGPSISLKKLGVMIYRER